MRETRRQRQLRTALEDATIHYMDEASDLRAVMMAILKELAVDEPDDERLERIREIIEQGLRTPDLRPTLGADHVHDG